MKTRFIKSSFTFAPELVREQDTTSMSNFSIDTNSRSFTDDIVKKESGGDYKATNPNSSAVGKYQFLWSLWGDKIKNYTGVSSKQDFINNPQAQDSFYNNYYVPNEMMPAIGRIKQKTNSSHNVDQLAKLYHFRGEQGAIDYLTGKLSDKPEAYNSSISDYTGIPKMQDGGYIVKKGDTLLALSKRFNTSIEELANLNNIKDINTIRVGQNLNIKPASKKTIGSVSKDIININNDSISVPESTNFVKQKQHINFDTNAKYEKLYNLTEEDLNSLDSFSRKVVQQELKDKGYYDSVNGIDNEKFRKAFNRYKERNNYIENFNEVPAYLQNAFRNVSPFPNNINQLLLKEVAGNSRIDSKSLGKKDNETLKGVIKEAIKRTGKTEQGTEYEDYGEDIPDKFNRGKNSINDMLIRSGTDSKYRVASTVGRGSYYEDPETGDLYYKDNYNWNKGEKNFTLHENPNNLTEIGENIYRRLRNKFRDNEGNEDDPRNDIRIKIENDMSFLRKNVPKKNLGGILGSTASGAATGAAFMPPYGAIVGGIIGLGKGLFDHTKENKLKKAQADKELEDFTAEQRIFNQTIEGNSNSAYRQINLNNTLGFLRKGGVPSPEYEAEKGEVVLGDPTLEEGTQLAEGVHEVGGQSHENGGTLGQGGEFIFSNDIKLNKPIVDMYKAMGIKLDDKMSFSDAAYKIGKLKSKYERNSNDHKKINTDRAMQGRLQQGLLGLAQFQESLKV